jgi:hypothetical protein
LHHPTVQKELFIGHQVTQPEAPLAIGLQHRQYRLAAEPCLLAPQTNQSLPNAPVKSMRLKTD